MNAGELLDFLQRNAVALAVEGDRLKFTAPRGVLNADIQARLKQHKAALIALLSGEAPAAPSSDGRERLPLSFAQRQLWFLNRLTPGNPFYNNPLPLGLRGRLDVDALRRALDGLVRRHETLRTVFPSVDGEPWQEILPRLALPLPVTDLAGLAEDRRQQALRDAIDDDARALFDLAVAPPIRARLLRLADDDFMLLMSVHHLAADGWSIGILIQELAALYRAEVAGVPSPLPALPIRHADHVRWQRQGDPARLRRQQDYWKAQLHGAPPLSTLPADRPRPAVQRHRGRRHFVRVAPEVAAGLRAKAAASQGTLFNTLMAALAVLLWRYGGQDDLCIGTPFANRNRSELEPLIGHFVNTVVIRSRIDPAAGVDTLLRQIRGTVLEAFDHQDLPFEQIVEALKPERSTAHAPLFQVMLVLRNLPRGGAIDLPGVTLRSVESSTEAAKFDLTLSVTDQGGALELEFDYNTDLYDHGTVAQWAAHYLRLLEQIADPADRPLAALALLSMAERDRLLVDFNRTAAPPVEGMIHTQFEAQAAATPDTIAVSDGRRSLRYAELNRRANRLAHRLRALGVRPDDRVALCVERGVELLVGLLGILKAGGAYVPIDPDYPAERLGYLLADCQPVAVVAQAALPVPPPADLPVVRIGMEAGAAEQGGRDDNPSVDGLRPSHLAYVIYTSGSTGQPKGVMVEHRAAVNFWQVMRQSTHAGLPVPSHVAVNSAYTFDMSLKGLLQVLSGHRLFILPQDIRADGRQLMRYLVEQRIDAFECTPTQLELLLAEGLLAEGLPDDGAHRPARILLGGEPISLPTWKRLAGACATRFFNMYGPTECTVDATLGEIEASAGRPHIGRPIANAQVYILDPQYRPAPVGVAGEIHVGGAGLARGYLNRPELTAERFITVTLGDGPSQRLYKTGDLARWLPDGRIDYLGRNDFQVKVRGFRIEPGEIENALLALPGVQEAAVLVERPEHGEPRLVAAIGRPDAAQPRQPAEWRADLLAWLPAHMIPAVFVELPRLPQTRNGKLDRQAVLDLARAMPAGIQVNLASPRDHVELALYQIWKQILLQPAIGIGDNFFDLGGTSISAIKMAHRVQETFGLALPLHELLRNPTVEALGARLRSGMPTGPAGNLIAFREGEGRQNLVCVHPAGGTAFCYLALAKVLPEACGVYGLQSPGIHPGEQTLPSIEAMAESYLAQIDRLTAAPLILTGLSYGGLVAYEMARRLAADGHPQVTVVLLDTQGVDDAAQRAEIAPVELAEFRSKLIKFNGMYPGIEDAQIERYFQVYNHNRMTRRHYQVPDTQARVVLIQAMGGRDRNFLREGRAFWRRRAQAGLRVRLVHGDHWEMLETAEVKRVDRTLRQELARHLAPTVGATLCQTSATLASEGLTS